jgi:hypothetical protein
MFFNKKKRYNEKETEKTFEVINSLTNRATELENEIADSLLNLKMSENKTDEKTYEASCDLFASIHMFLPLIVACVDVIQKIGPTHNLLEQMLKLSEKYEIDEDDPSIRFIKFSREGIEASLKGIDGYSEFVQKMKEEADKNGE